MKVLDGIPVWGDPVDEGAFRQIQTCRESAVRAALMADHHLGYSVPIGGVVAYEDKISPSGVGYDIACGNKAVRVDADVADVRKNISKIMDDIWNTLSFGIGMKNNERVDHELFDDEAWKLEPARSVKQKAREQLGTIGGGNHYVDLFVDEQDRVWIGVHFGSRGFGHTVASYFIRKGGGRDGMFVEPVLLDVRSSIGADYLAQMELAGRYAYAGRDWVCDRVAKILGARIVEEVHNHHNFAWKERHGGRDLWVVRKGATPAFPGQRGFVGGSMGDISVILEGVDSDESKAALYSTVHGAGRVMSRTQAAGKRKWGKKKGSTGGQITRAMMMDWVRKMGVELRGADTDESPHCYKRLPDVLAEHGKTIRIVHTLQPIGVAMAGPDVYDPYKD
ncbi:MAG: RNA-splicing ligase RtcB [Fimbriimonadales bacterium]|nr:MAG: RNA-splicing ligase RtcB [Fimbriimonadales bacterium]